MNEFVKPILRPLPVILLLDTSGSMYGESIDTLNIAVKKMIDSFADQESTMAKIFTAIITFGGRASVHTEFQSASEIKWRVLDANGMTPLGGALKLCRDMIDNLTKDQFNGKPYKPTVVLVSDGGPTDNYEGVLEEFVTTKKTGTCDRWALAIGEHADYSVLEKFISGQEKRVWEAAEASSIAKFFQLVTNSTQNRTTSGNPNRVPTIEELDNISLDGLVNGDVMPTAKRQTDAGPTIKPTEKVPPVRTEDEDDNDESPFSF